jgi:3-oxoacyl-[acyl-carrier protein] reductase
MVTPIELVRRVIDGMVDRQFGRVVNITSAAVKMPLPGLDVSSGTQAGPAGFLAGVARSVAHANETINFLLPGRAIPTGCGRRSRPLPGGPGPTRRRTGRRKVGIPAKRFGDPAEFGAACAFLYSARAGYITGPGLLIDGGAYPGVLRAGTPPLVRPFAPGGAPPSAGPGGPRYPRGSDNHAVSVSRGHRP